jgi:signal transduction histidine kinase
VLILGMMVMIAAAFCAKSMTVTYCPVWFVLGGGLVISGLLCALIRTRSSTRVQAQQIAEQLTADARRSEERLRWRVETEQLISAISSHFINIEPGEAEPIIAESMAQIGRFEQVDRVYIFMLDPTGEAMSNTHEWCSDQVRPEMMNLQNIPTAVLPWWMEKLRKLEVIYIPRVSDLPPAANAEKKILQAQAIQSLLVVPLAWDGALLGFLGFDSVRVAREWDREHIAPMKLLGNVLISAIKRKEGEQALRASQIALREINSTLEEKVAARTHELQDIQARLFLHERMVSIGQLAAGIAHELNNPIGFVFNNFNALKESMGAVKEVLAAYKDLAMKAEAIPNLADSVQKIRNVEEAFKIDVMLKDLDLLFEDSREGFGRITSIINSMRDFSRTDQVGDREAFNINHGIETTLVIARNEYKHHCEVETVLGGLTPILCNASQINQVFLSIIMNAAHAIASQHRQEKGRIRIATYESDEQVCCDISDDGPGMAEEVRRRIFDPFFTTKGPGKGKGLGLSIAYDCIVKKHHGDLTVESHCGTGTIFRIRLPKGAVHRV